MMKKRLLSPLLALCMVLALLPAALAAAYADFSIKNGELVEYTGSGGAITIPDSVASIGQSAFYNCSRLTSVTIPDSVTSIGDFAFYNCGSMTSVTIPDSVTYIGRGAFSICDSLIEVHYSGSESQWKQITIGDSNEALTGSIIYYAKTDSREDNVKWVYIYGNLTIEGTGSMEGLISSTPPWDEYSENIQTVRISDGLTSISDEAFLFYSSLTGVTIPNSVTRIGTRAFMGCSSLAGVTIPSGVTTLEAGTFMWCGRLTSVTIPGSVTYIGDSAFMGCGSLTDVYYSGSEGQWNQIFIDANNDPLAGAAIHYNSTGPDSPSAPEAPAAPAAPTAPAAPAAPATDAVLSPQKLTVDGSSVDCEKYNIGGSNYFKLRDLAYLLNGTASQFGVNYDEMLATVRITTGAAYVPAGTELTTGVDNSGTAQRSSQSILIDGTAHGELTVYNIGGSNFFQLRELGNLLGFAVDYDASSNTAIVRSKQNETPDHTEDPDQAPAADDPAGDQSQTPPPEATLANGKAITDENIREIIYGFKSGYPEGVPWTNDNSYMSPTLLRIGYGCEAFALMCSDAAFGDLPISSEHSNFDHVKVGDMLRINNDTHTVIVLEKRPDSVVVAEGNYNNAIHWGREISRQSLEEGNFTVCSRYPVG